MYPDLYWELISSVSRGCGANYQIKERCILESTFRDLALIPIQSSQQKVQVWILVSYHLQVAFENAEIRNIETNNCCVKSDVCFCDVLSENIWLMIGITKVLFETIERLEKWEDVVFVCLLARGET